MEENWVKIHKAIEYAAIKHRKGLRKGTNTPYIVHPFEVAMILKESEADTETITAGILHDVLEDTDATLEEIREIFGSTICSYVVGASEKLEKRENTPWRDRKLYTIEFLRSANMNVKLIACADKLSNIRSIALDAETDEKIWTRFKADFQEQSWHYHGLVESLSSLAEYQMYKEFQLRVNEVFSPI